MVKRDYWLQKIESSWEKRSLVWLSGVRRVGKTTLARLLSDAVYFNCDLPSVREVLADPERFYKSLSSARIILDEVHQLPDPSTILKIGTDTYPHIKILATGSSTLTAAKKFRDSLTGRKYEVHLLPVLFDECPLFGIADIRHRLQRGGLPQPLMAAESDPAFYTEWMDSFFARDIQELFRVDKRHGFLHLMELLFRQSGSLADISSLAKHSSLSRPTVMNYLDILELTHTITVMRPYFGNGKQELTHQPKIYSFDTGFVAHARGWNELRPDDCGMLWEQLVLEYLQAYIPAENIRFWRDKQKREIDFVIPRDRDTVDVIECKWNHEAFNAGALKVFRSLYPQGKNYVVSPSIPLPFSRVYNGCEVKFCTPSGIL